MDVERNLRAPLAGIARWRSGRRPFTCPGCHAHRRHAAGSAPSSPATRPDILITTPESLYLLLTSSARDALLGPHRHRGRDPRAGRHQARRPPGPLTGAAGGAGPALPARRPLGDGCGPWRRSARFLGGFLPPPPADLASDAPAPSGPAGAVPDGRAQVLTPG